MSKLLCKVDFYRSSTWLKPSVESLLEYPIAKLFLDWIVINVDPTGSAENLCVQKEGTQL